MLRESVTVRVLPSRPTPAQESQTLREILRDLPQPPRGYSYLYSRELPPTPFPTHDEDQLLADLRAQGPDAVFLTVLTAH